MKTPSEQFLRKRKFLLVLPFLALPFITLAFWALGGGKATPALQNNEQKLNSTLPGAQLGADGPLDKMSLYNQAAKDSLALRDRGQADPYGRSDDADTGSSTDPAFDAHIRAFDPGASAGLKTGSDPNELRVRARLAELERTLSQPPPPASVAAYPGGYRADPGMGRELDRLEQLMQQMSPSSAADPEMQQLGSMLEQIQDIQDPARAKEKLRQQSQRNRGRVYPVSKPPAENVTTLIPRAEGGNMGTGNQPIPVTGYPANNGFYTIEPLPSAMDTLMQTAIPAVVNETQTLVSGGTVKMRLVEDIFVNGVLIPSGSFVSGQCSIDGERLKIEVTAIRYGKSLFPVSMSCYDPDGIEGIRIPGALSRDAAKEGADRALQSVQLLSLDPSIGAQAAGAGVEVAKGLFGKKAKLIRVTVKAGHPVLLMDQKARQALQ
ncbi:conjugative transposon protein TraM [Pedobacter sp. KR3-3]|uniref:Conjugative transposon protein TraM n=1 Tax=Pedobacter albus TaxID=3113905 RepID=A0ABU7IAL1_9SPHI|nr:conjugative transposon protein TraM [Pedobacter sp. KR3-3]MEE1946399.1 conjugative transposon protein TraM [Pedobacter sp. KR3-3]